VGAEDDDDPLDRGHPEHRLDRVIEQGPALKLDGELGAPEAPAPAGGEDEAADQAPTSWIRPAAVLSRPPSWPFRTATTSARIRQPANRGQDELEVRG
jgi:hypothetical protein